MKILKSKEEAIDFLTWIATLESGIFEQGVGGLQTGENAYCCLGVACIITIPEDKLKNKVGNFIGGGYPTTQSHAPEWLKNINVIFSSRSGEDYLSVMNDKGVSHPTIAKKLLKVFREDLDYWFQ